MKILMLQLPLLSYSRGYLNGNVPCGPAALGAFIKKNFPDTCSIEYLPFEITSFASDNIIMREIERISPDIISFSCFLWNIERHLYLAQMCKKILPHVTVIFGGAEVSPGSSALTAHYPQVDFFYTGEGEWFFQRYLRGDNMHHRSETLSGNSLIHQPAEDLLFSHEIVEPLTAGELEVMPDRSIFLELTRGCPWRCSYCYYSKNSRRVRELPFSLLTDAIAAHPDLSEIYILSPTFDASPDFIDRLKILKDMKHGISLHTELRPSAVTPETADLLFDAGFRSLEVGLQTLSPGPLERVRRRSDPEKELEGICYLNERGIDLKIGIIPGLPGETAESFKITMDRLLEMGLGEAIELYPLMILPGTAIREEAEKEKIHFMTSPPYYYVDGWGMSAENIREAGRYLERATGLSTREFSLPDFSFTRDRESSLTAACMIQSDPALLYRGNTIESLVETSLFSFHFQKQTGEKLYCHLEKIKDKLPPHHLFNMVFYEKRCLDEKRLDNLFGASDDSLESRLNFFSSAKMEGRVRFFHVTGNLKLYSALDSNYRLIEPILSCRPGNNQRLPRFIEKCATLPPLLITAGGYPSLESLLLRFYSDIPETVAFEREEEQMLWYDAAGLEHIRYPLGFTSVTI